MDQYKTWYLKLNPGAYVPTMLIRGNIPICESIDIIEYMDNKLDGQNKLMSNQTDLSHLSAPSSFMIGWGI